MKIAVTSTHVHVIASTATTTIVTISHIGTGRVRSISELVGICVTVMRVDAIKELLVVDGLGMLNADGFAGGDVGQG